MKLVLRPRSTLVAKSIPKLPGAVLGTSPIVVTAGGLNYTVSLDLPTLVASLNVYYAPIGDEVRISLMTSKAMMMAAGVEQKMRRKVASDQIALVAQVFS